MSCYGCPAGCQRCDPERAERRYAAARELAVVATKERAAGRRDVLDRLRELTTDWPTLQVINQVAREFGL